MIPDSFVQDLLARVSIEDVVGQYVQLRKGGANLLGLCPFHNEKTPSFTVSPSKQFFHCFGCGANGNAVGFIMRHTGASFPQAVRNLAAQAGMTVPEERQSPQQREQARQRRAEASLHEEILKAAQAHYVAQLKASAPAIEYLKQRGLDGHTAARYGLGWSGGGRRALAGVIAEYDSAAAVETGMVIESEDGRRHDRFRKRIMFPIRDVRGRIIGFGGRLIAPGEPKYLNSPETPLFSKGQELYGLWEGAADIRKQGYVVVTEGYMDVVMLAQHGLGNAVATLGTATTARHVQKLMRASTRIVFCFDGDAAGRRAAWRALGECLPLLRDDSSIRFLFLPAEHDPDSYVREQGEAAFRAALTQAPPLSQFLLDELAARHPLDEAEGRSACAHEAAPLFARIQAPALRMQIERAFAQLVRLTPDELGLLLNQAQAQGAGGAHASAMRTEAASRPPAGPARREPGRLRGAARHGAGTSRRVTPLVSRLLRLLLSSPSLIDSLGEHQLEILMHRPHLALVREFITLANASGARHAGALLEAAPQGSELARVLASLAADALLAEDLPDPQAEWSDALTHIEIEAIRAEQQALVDAGLASSDDQRRYQELTRQLALLKRAGSAQLQ